MLWGLVDTFVDELIACYGSRDQAERALLDVLADQPEWAGTFEIVPVPTPTKSHWRPAGRRAARFRCKTTP